mmetsp:Transcript_6426/g.8694  ORF Transcript_6426/g.8694 Transcript_6426/m.8694 type:complete len:200 (+) Transcript_6426:447-1046(+)
MTRIARVRRESRSAGGQRCPMVISSAVGAGRVARHSARAAGSSARERWVTASQRRPWHDSSSSSSSYSAAASSSISSSSVVAPPSPAAESCVAILQHCLPSNSCNFKSPSLTVPKSVLHFSAFLKNCTCNRPNLTRSSFSIVSSLSSASRYALSSVSILPVHSPEQTVCVSFNTSTKTASSCDDTDTLPAFSSSVNDVA